MRSIFYFLTIFSLLSCSELLENINQRDAEDSYTSPYKGAWIGTYSGNESGTLLIEVAKNGYTSLTRTSSNGSETSFLSGMVRDDGALQSVIMESGFTLYGNFVEKSGTWKMGERNGNWSVKKQ